MKKISFIFWMAFSLAMAFDLAIFVNQVLAQENEALSNGNPFQPNKSVTNGWHEGDSDEVIAHGRALQNAWINVEPVESEAASEGQAVEEADSLASDNERQLAMEEVEEVNAAQSVVQSFESTTIRYVIERIIVEGNESTSTRVILGFINLKAGDVHNVDDSTLEDAKWRLLSTGWFSEVRFKLKKGSKKGHVHLILKVQERNTLVFQQLGFGISEGLSGSTDTRSDIVPYLNFSAAEMNLLGLGVELSLTALLSVQQQGFRVDFVEPFILGSQQLAYGSVGFNNARQFFGTDPLVSVSCSSNTRDCPEEIKDGKNAVVFYRRTTFGLGTGGDLPNFLRYKIGWHGDVVDVTAKPESASERRGNERRPIDFSILDGRSFVSMIEGQVVYERKNDSAFPSEGVYFKFHGSASSKIIGSNYNFFRMQSQLRWWIPTHKGQSIELGTFFGAVFGEAPLFYQFHIADFSDFIPDRVLEMNLDRRPAPNFLNTAIREMRNEKIATSISAQYNLPIYKGTGGVRLINTYGKIGLFLLADHQDFVFAVPGYEGFAKAPLDLTFDFGAQLDTDIGVFKFGFSNLLGLISF